MREILFRGKRTDTGEWIEGYFEKYKGCAYINLQTERLNSGGYPIREFVEVIPETVGEYTSKTDKKNKKIFEGDIVSHFINWLGKRVNGVVRYDSKVASWVCDFVLDDKKESAFLADWANGNGAEIIGNFIDNPELLKESEDTE